MTHEAGHRKGGELRCKPEHVTEALSTLRRSEEGCTRIGTSTREVEVFAGPRAVGEEVHVCRETRYWRTAAEPGANRRRKEGRSEGNRPRKAMRSNLADQNNSSKGHEGKGTKKGLDQKRLLKYFSWRQQVDTGYRQCE